jgi:glutamate racemase
VRRFAHEIGVYLERQGVKMVVVACNTATSVALPDLQEQLSVPVVSVIVPEAHAAVQATRNRRIGLLGTELTVASGRYESLVHTLDAGARLSSVACPKLVPLIEAGDTFSDEVNAAVREYAEPLKEAGCDTVILGCTHYPLLRPVFQRTFARASRTTPVARAPIASSRPAIPHSSARSASDSCNYHSATSSASRWRNWRRSHDDERRAES